MKKIILLTFLLINTKDTFAFVDDIAPVEWMVLQHKNLMMDNPKGKLKIKFVLNDFRSSSDTTKPKGLFAKIKNVVNSLLDASDNPPFKLQVIRDKKR